MTCFAGRDREFSFLISQRVAVACMLSTGNYISSISLSFSHHPKLVLRPYRDQGDNSVISIYTIVTGARYPNCRLCLQHVYASCLPLHMEAQENTSRKVPTIRELCEGFVPDVLLRRAEKARFIRPTDLQLQALPMLFTGRDCILHSQTGSGKTLAYLLLILAVLNPEQSDIQALIVVPENKIGWEVAKVARMLLDDPPDCRSKEKLCSVMTILGIKYLNKVIRWLESKPPPIVIATTVSLCKALEKGALNLQYLQVLVIDEANSNFHSSAEVAALRELLASYSTANSRQTIFAGPSIPELRQFIRDCIQQKWTKTDVTHIHVNPMGPMHYNLSHRFVICRENERRDVLLSLLRSDAPKLGIIFVNQQLEGSKEAGNVASVVVDFLKTSDLDGLRVHLLEENMFFDEIVKGGGHLLVATDRAARGVDLREMTHIYNYHFPETTTKYVQRAGRTGGKPLSGRCIVTNLILASELFDLLKYENELKFQCQELFV